MKLLKVVLSKRTIIASALFAMFVVLYLYVLSYQDLNVVPNQIEAALHNNAIHIAPGLTKVDEKKTWFDIGNTNDGNWVHLQANSKDTPIRSIYIQIRFFEIDFSLERGLQKELKVSALHVVRTILKEIDAKGDIDKVCNWVLENRGTKGASRSFGKLNVEIATLSSSGNESVIYITPVFHILPHRRLSGKNQQRLPTTLDNTFTDIDGNIYNTIKIGNQVWAKENLKTTKFNDGTNIPNIMSNEEWSNLTTPGYCFFIDDKGKETNYGALYNWYAVDTRKLAPRGWHVPTFEEWDTLQQYLISNVPTDSQIKWTEIAKSNKIDNSLGFYALAGGYRGTDGMFSYQNQYGDWWSYHGLKYGDQLNCRFNFFEVSSLYLAKEAGKKAGLSVRLLKD